MARITILSTDQLAEIGREGIHRKTNRGITAEGIEMLDPEGIHVVRFHMLHNDTEVRAEIMVKITGTDEPGIIWQDMPLDYFMRLPTVDAEAIHEAAELAREAEKAGAGTEAAS
jgi:hypothetical protein